MIPTAWRKNLRWSYGVSIHEAELDGLDGYALLSLTLLELIFLTPAVAETGLSGSYAGVPVDVGTVLKNANGSLNPTNLTSAIANQVLSSSGITPTFTPDAESKSANPVGAQFQGRYDLPNSPLSIRGSIYIGDSARAILPAVTYDLPVGGGTNVYAGAGVSLVNAGVGKVTPLGDRTGIVVTTGVESEVSKGIIVYGDAKWLPSNKVTGTPPLRYQLGVGYRF